MTLCCFTPVAWKLKCVIGVICIVIFGFSACIALSIPFNTTVYYSYAAEIRFNEGMFTGSVNDFSVHNLLTLRLGNWAASYTDSKDPDFQMPGAFAYMVDITSHNSTRTIVTKLNTGLLIIHIFFFISTLFTCFHVHLPKRWTKLFIFEIAIMATSLASILSDLWLLSNVSAEMQKLGETIVTTQGPVFYLIGIVDCFVVVAAILNRKLANEIAKPAPSADGKGPAKYQLTVNPAAVQPVAPPSAVPLTPYQRVQALMPPRVAPAAPKKAQVMAAPAAPAGNVPPYYGGQLRPRHPPRRSRPTRPTNERRLPSRLPTPIPPLTPSQRYAQDYRKKNSSPPVVTNPSLGAHIGPTWEIEEGGGFRIRGTTELDRPPPTGAGSSNNQPAVFRSTIPQSTSKSKTGTPPTFKFSVPPWASSSRPSGSGSQGVPTSTIARDDSKLKEEDPAAFKDEDNAAFNKKYGNFAKYNDFDQFYDMRKAWRTAVRLGKYVGDWENSEWFSSLPD